MWSGMGGASSVEEYVKAIGNLMKALEDENWVESVFTIWSYETIDNHQLHKCIECSSLIPSSYLVHAIRTSSGESHATGFSFSHLYQLKVNTCAMVW